MRTEKIVIIGAGPAGCAAAVQCKRLGISPTLLDSTGAAGGLIRNAFSIENYPGLDPIDGKAFALLLQDHIARFEIQVEQGAVQLLTAADDWFEIEGDFGEIRARSVIVSVGTTGRGLDIQGASDLEEDGLYYDVRSPLDSSPSDRKMEKAIVIGGGEAALDYTLTLEKSGLKTTLFVRSKRLRARGRLVELVTQNQAIETVFNTRPLSICRTADKVSLYLEGPCGPVTSVADFVVAAIGRSSRVDGLLKGLDVNPSGKVSTSLPGLFLAGDARTGSLGQAGMAIGDGLAAAMEAVAIVGSRAHKR